MGSIPNEMICCYTCWRWEWDWRTDLEGYYTCANCRDLLDLARQQDAFTNLHRHLAGILPHPFSLPSLFEHLHSIKLTHTRAQRRDTLRFFLLGAPNTHNFFYDLRVECWEQLGRIRRNGKVYYTSIHAWGFDVIDAISDFLI